MAPHSSILAWEIPWIAEPGGLQCVGSQRVGHDWAAGHAHTPAPSHPGRWSEKLFCSLDFYVLCLLIDRLRYSIFDKYFTEGSIENVPMYHIRRHTMIVTFLDDTEFDPSFEVVLTSFFCLFFQSKIHT